MRYPLSCFSIIFLNSILFDDTDSVRNKVRSGLESSAELTLHGLSRSCAESNGIRQSCHSSWKQLMLHCLNSGKQVGRANVIGLSSEPNLLEGVASSYQQSGKHKNHLSRISFSLDAGRLSVN